MIRLKEVSLRLGNADRSSSVLFHLPSFEVEAGEAVALTGPSGCGKSTLLNLIAGLRRADQGQVEVAGSDLGKLNSAQLDRHRGMHCGMVFQTFHLLAPFTALENALFSNIELGRPAFRMNHGALRIHSSAGSIV